MFSWIVGAFFAGGLAFVVGKVALGLRADYLAIATLLISEIVISIIKHEDWLSRGVKNVIGLDRPVPYEVNLQAKEWFINLVAKFNSGKLELISNMADKQTALNQLVIEGSSVFVKTLLLRFVLNCSYCIINRYSKSTLFTLGKNDESN